MTGRPKLPPHRRRARVKHPSLTAYQGHMNEPEIFGPVCEACRNYMREYHAKRRKVTRQRRERLRKLLTAKAWDTINEMDSRPLTTQELDVAVRVIRKLDELLLEDWRKQ